MARIINWDTDRRIREGRALCTCGNEIVGKFINFSTNNWYSQYPCGACGIRSLRVVNATGMLRRTHPKGPKAAWATE